MSIDKIVGAHKHPKEVKNFERSYERQLRKIQAREARKSTRASKGGTQ